jgi:spore coat protein U-like protein
MKGGIAVLLVLGILPSAGLYAQQTASTTFRVAVSVQAACEVTATDLDLGTHAAEAGSPHQGTTLLRATCTPDSSYNIRLNDGTSPGATVNQRKMVSGAQVRNYQLYSEAQRSTVWGNTTGTDTANGVGTGLSQDHTVFGAVPAAQVIPASGYAETIIVRIYY